VGEKRGEDRKNFQVCGGGKTAGSKGNYKKRKLGNINVQKKREKKKAEWAKRDSEYGEMVTGLSWGGEFSTRIEFKGEKSRHKKTSGGARYRKLGGKI